VAEFAYPTRPKVFALKFVRLMIKKCVANDLGPQTFTLLAVVAATEDARGYTDAVSFFNEQLMPLVGAGSVDTLDRIRRKAVEAEWLSYAPGTKGKPGRYYVRVPDRHRGTDDAPTDEDPEPGFLRTGADESAEVAPGFLRTGAEATRGNVRKEPEGMCGTLLPVPGPVSKDPPNPPPTGGVVAGAPGRPKCTRRRKIDGGGPEHPLFAQFWAAYPRREKRAGAAEVFARLDPSPELLAKILAAIGSQKRPGGALEGRVVDGRSTVPHPPTWLNGRRWEDEPPAPVVSNAAGPPATTTAEKNRQQVRALLAAGETTPERAAQLMGGPDHV
jgi:hypothetical protein